MACAVSWVAINCTVSPNCRVWGPSLSLWVDSVSWRILSSASSASLVAPSVVATAEVTSVEFDAMVALFSASMVTLPAALTGLLAVTPVLSMKAVAARLILLVAATPPAAAVLLPPIAAPVAAATLLTVELTTPSPSAATSRAPAAVTVEPTILAVTSERGSLLQ